MISVGSSDGRKGLRLGFGGGGGGMEETELEEGEARFYQDAKHETSFDPDVDLSYIDEKIQDILGHFQKDFEGGVSAENLGSKFGGYGSFLPSYQRSPSILSHPRTPQKVQNYSTPKSPNNFLSESVHQNAIIPSSSTFSTALGPTSTSAAPQSVSRASSVDDSFKRDLCLSSARVAEEFTSKHEPVNKLVNPTDQKTLKVRIKVGPDSLLAQKNAAIYSGLGLDLSPSSSVEDSPTQSRGLSPESRVALDGSPMSILQIMTSLPVHGGCFLSPLSDDLLCLMEKEILPSDDRSGPPQKGGQESPSLLVDNSSSIIRIRKASGEKKKNSGEKRSMELRNGSSKGAGDGNSNLLKMEMDIETPAETAWEPLTCHVINKVEKQTSKTSSAGRVWEDRKTSPCKDVQFDMRNDGSSKGDKSYEFDGSKCKESIDPPKQKPGQKDTSHEQDGQKGTSHEQDAFKMPHGKERPPGGKMKSKGSQSNVIPPIVFPKESLRVDSSSSTRDKKKKTGDYPFKNELGDNRLNRESCKTIETHRDLFGNVEQGESIVDSLETPFTNGLKDPTLDVAEKEAHKCTQKTNEKSSGKKFDNSLTSKAYPEAGAIITSSLGEVASSDVVPAIVAPVFINENWVGCDKCQKWRLLPYGRNPDELPKKWQCSMLNWLPGMNRCDISEDDTTKALNAMYQVPAPESKNNMQIHPDGLVSGVTLADVSHLDQTQQDHSLHTMPCKGKKKRVSRGASVNTDGHISSTHVLNSTKKNQQTSVKHRSSNDVNQTPLESNLANNAGLQNLGKSGGMFVEKHSHKRKETNKLLLGQGDAKHSKTNNKRGADREGFSASKKIKTEGLRYPNEDWNSDLDGVKEKVGPSSSNGLPAKATRQHVHNDYSEYSAKDAKFDANEGRLPAFVKKLNDQVQASSIAGDLDNGKCDARDIVTKKRKVKGCQETQIYLPEALPITGHCLKGDRASMKELSVGEFSKEKKARVSKSDWKQSDTTKGGGKTDKKGRVTQMDIPDGMEEEGRGYIDKDQLRWQYRGNTVPQHILEDIHSLKRNLGYGKPSMAVTPSSSEVSGSHKIKANFQELKGSPVESVSSSPLRISNPDKIMSAGRDLTRKDYSTNVMGGMKRSSEDEGGESDHLGTVRKDKASSDIHRRSLERSVVGQQQKDVNHTLSGRAKAKAEPSAFENIHTVNGCTDAIDQHNHYPGDLQGREHRYNGSLPPKSGKGSLQSKDKHKSFISDFGTTCVRDGKTKLPNNLQRDHGGERSLNRSLLDGADRLEATSEREKSHKSPQPLADTHMGSESAVLPVDASCGSGDISKSNMPKQSRKPDNQNGFHHSTWRQPTPSGLVSRDLETRSPVRKDCSNQAAANALKEATDLKHSADRLKHSGLELESTGIYFEAALKFLHGALLLELCTSDSAKHGDMTRSMHVYGDTAKLCEFIAREYERYKKMASAALAYKCMEVAYMRVMYSKHSSVSNDRHELQKALQMVPSGESPSSSASDVDNLNNQGLLDKVDPARGVSSQFAGNHAIVAHNRPNFVRLLNFAEDCNLAMEASRKSWNAFAAVNVGMEEAQSAGGIASVKRVLDFNFHDIEGLLRLVRLAMEAISL